MASLQRWCLYSAGTWLAQSHQEQLYTHVTYNGLNLVSRIFEKRYSG